MKAYRAMSGQTGEMNILLVPVILLGLFFVGAAIFGFWAYGGMQDYKLNADQKIAAAVKIAQDQQSDADTKAHDEADKQPLKTYSGPEQYGSLHVSFPKTWSAYVIDSGNGGSAPLDAYFQPGIVPSINDQNSTFALRVVVLNQSYASVVKQYSSAVTAKTVTSAAYAFPKVPNAIGIRYDGAIKQSKKISGTMIVVPIRDKTLEVWTESPIYSADFTNSILPNVSFSP